MTIDLRSPGTITTTAAADLRSVWYHRPDGLPVLGGIDVVVGPAERLAITGPPGSGATTLARILAGRAVPSRGTARVVGTLLVASDLAGLRRVRRKVGVVESTLHLPDDATVGEAVRMGSRAADVLDLVGGGLDPASRAGDLSPVDRCRLALALVAAAGPDLVVADDPWRHLDPAAASMLGCLAARVAGDLGSALVAIGRDAPGLPGIGRVLVLDAGTIT